MKTDKIKIIENEYVQLHPFRTVFGDTRFRLRCLWLFFLTLLLMFCVAYDLPFAQIYIKKMK